MRVARLRTFNISGENQHEAGARVGAICYTHRAPRAPFAERVMMGMVIILFNCD